MEWPPEVGALQEMVSPFPVWPPLPLLGGLINMYFPGDPCNWIVTMVSLCMLTTTCFHEKKSTHYEFFTKLLSILLFFRQEINFPIDWIDIVVPVYRMFPQRNEKRIRLKISTSLTSFTCHVCLFLYHFSVKKVVNITFKWLYISMNIFVMSFQIITKGIGH